MIKKLWSDPVWSKVIAGVILAIGATVVSYFLNWWPTIGRFVSEVYAFAFSTTSVPNWFIALMVILSIPTFIIAIVLAKEKIWLETKNSESGWRSYKSDIYIKLRWRWKYFDDGGIYDLVSFCSHCDFQVFAQNASAYRVVDRIGFHCDSCDRTLNEIDESIDSLENKIKRFIQQKLRTGAWAETRPNTYQAPGRQEVKFTAYEKD
jgi:hypothetical protein